MEIMELSLIFLLPLLKLPNGWGGLIWSENESKKYIFPINVPGYWVFNFRLRKIKSSYLPHLGGRAII